MVPAIRTILGGFLFGGDDIYKKAGVLSGGERTRLAVARMLLRPANTLLLDEPTNHLDMDSKDVLLDALEDFGGTLILVSHDRYFIDKLATKVIDVGGGAASVYPGGYEEYRWSLAKREEEAAAKAAAPAKPAPAKAAPAKAAPAAAKAETPQAQQRRRPAPKPRAAAAAGRPGDGREDRKRQEAEERRRKRAREAVEGRIATLEAHHRRARSDDEDARGDDERARLLREPRHLEADDRSAPGADVGARRPDAPLGRAAAGARSRRPLTGLAGPPGLCPASARPLPGLCPASARPPPGLRPASSRPRPASRLVPGRPARVQRRITIL